MPRKQADKDPISQASSQQRRLQKHTEHTDNDPHGRHAQGAVQAGARHYPEPPFPKQHQPKPGAETLQDVSKFGADTAMKRPAQPEEIAPLASAQCSSYISGEILPIVGGY